jgi:hypothetical protein
MSFFPGVGTNCKQTCAEPPLSIGKRQQTALRSCLALLQPPPSESSLIEIYLGLSNPAFPLVFLQLDERPPDPLLHTKLCLAALNHCRHYRSSIASIRSIVSTSAEEGDNLKGPSRLGCISAALLDLSARPVLDVEASYILLARVCECLGHTVPCITVVRLSHRHSFWVFTSTPLHGLFHLGKRIFVAICGESFACSPINSLEPIRAGGRYSFMMPGRSCFYWFTSIQFFGAHSGCRFSILGPPTSRLTIIRFSYQTSPASIRISTLQTLLALQKASSHFAVSPSFALACSPKSALLPRGSCHPQSD